VSGGKKKPLKQPKKDAGELDEVCTFTSTFLIKLLMCNIMHNLLCIMLRVITVTVNQL